jgi:hypothetical protein
MSEAEMAALVDPSKPVHRVFLKQLDAHAKGLKELADAGVVVLYHPYVESDGGHFWWGRKGKHFVNMWRFQVDYLNKQKGLHNILWVCDARGDCYPGNKYVDIYGPHVYGHSSSRQAPLDRAWRGHIEHKIKRQRYPKPFIIGETGARTGRIDWDALEMLRVLKRLPRIVAYQNWCDLACSLVGTRNAYGLVNDPLILNRGELTVRGGKPHTKPAVLPDRAHILRAWEWYHRGWGAFVRDYRLGDGWTRLPPMKKKLQQGGSALIGEVGGPNAGLQSPDKLGVEIGPNVGIQIAVINQTEAETLSVAFTTEGDSKWDETKRLTCSISADNEFDVYDQRYHVYRLRGEKVPAWKGKLKQFQVRLGPKATSGILRVDHVRVIDLNRAPAR